MMQNFLSFTGCTNTLSVPSHITKLLFTDFSSAFNKMQLHVLTERLTLDFKVPDYILLLLLNFLINRIHQVFVNRHILNCNLKYWLPSGLCLLLLPHQYVYWQLQVFSGSYLVKFSDDTALLSLLQGDQSDHGSVLPAFVDWCDNNFLDLNITKTQEFIIDFSKGYVELKDRRIHGKEVQIVQNYRYLETVEFWREH